MKTLTSEISAIFNTYYGSSMCIWMRMSVHAEYLYPILYVLGGIFIAITIQLSMIGDGVTWRWSKIGILPIGDGIDIFRSTFQDPASGVIISGMDMRWFGKCRSSNLAD